MKTKRNYFWWGLLAFLLYLPFYVSFSSQAGGLLPNLEYPTRGAHLWVMFGTLFPPLLAYLLYLWRREKRRAYWKLGVGLALGLVLLLWSFSLLLGFLAQMKMPDFVAGYLQAQGFISAALFIGATLLRRLVPSRLLDPASRPIGRGRFEVTQARAFPSGRHLPSRRSLLLPAVHRRPGRRGRRA